MSWYLAQADAEHLPLRDRCVHCVVTSPPYWGLRYYGVEGAIGLESTLDQYIDKLVAVFREARRVLRDDGTLWLNMGDSYTSGNRATYRSGASANKGHNVQDDMPRPANPEDLGSKQLIGQPWRVAFALQDSGWYLRSDIIWAKPNPMPESVKDRPTKSHEHVFLLTKRATYYYDAEAVREGVLGASIRRARAGFCPSLRDEHNNYGDGFQRGEGYELTGRNLRDVWTISTERYPEAHFATFPRKLVEPCIKAGTSDKGCCPECGAPWVRVVDKERRPTRPGVNIKCDAKTWDKDTLATIPGRLDGNVIGNRDPQRHVTESRTVGWQPGCKCLSDDVALVTGEPDNGVPVPFTPIPCTVLDPFAGSGTTGVVARQLGRCFIGVELNPAYCDMARRRIQNPEPGVPIPDVPDQTVMPFA